MLKHQLEAMAKGAFAKFWVIVDLLEVREPSYKWLMPWSSPTWTTAASSTWGAFKKRSLSWFQVQLPICQPAYYMTDMGQQVFRSNLKCTLKSFVT